MSEYQAGKQKDHVLQCQSCAYKSVLPDFNEIILSISYRAKYKSFQLFKQIKCPSCFKLVNILFEEMDAA